MASTRGLHGKVYSDNALQFKRANKEIVETVLKNNEKIANFADKYKFKWYFAVEYFSTGSGVWERQVKSVKQPLRKVLGNALVTYTELITILKEIEAHVNELKLFKCFPGKIFLWETRVNAGRSFAEWDICQMYLPQLMLEECCRTSPQGFFFATECNSEPVTVKSDEDPSRKSSSHDFSWFFDPLKMFWHDCLASSQKSSPHSKGAIADDGMVHLGQQAKIISNVCSSSEQVKMIHFCDVMVWCALKIDIIWLFKTGLWPSPSHHWPQQRPDE